MQSSVPSTGTHVAGDLSIEPSPHLSGAVLWKCLTGGSPGTWALLQAQPTRATAANDTITLKDRYLGVTSTSAARTVTLPPASTVPDGWDVLIKDESGAVGSNSISVTPAGSDLIDGVNTAKTITAAYGFVKVMCRGAKWWTV